MEGFFDEKSGKWIKIYKGITKVMFWLVIAVGAIWGLLAFFGVAYFMDLGSFVDCILLWVVSAIVAICILVPNMLIIQFLNNVQLIREKLETKE